MKILSWLLAITASMVLLQTLYFKFSAQAESVYIFETIGMEPWGRIGSGIAELIAAILLLVPRTRVWGAFVGLTVISGALFFHLTSLGIIVQGDGGSLFYLALLVFVCSLILLFIERNKLINYVKNTFKT